MTRSRLVGVIALLVALAVAGCTATSAPTHTHAHTVVPVAEPTKLPFSPALVCGGGTTPTLASSSLWLSADGAWFDTGLVGPVDSTTVAVFVHQSDRDYCGWWTYVQYLAQHGVRSVLLDLCGFGQTVCPAREPVLGSGATAVLVAAQWAKAHGATRVVAVGASMGGTATILAASRDKGHILNAVADLSGPIAYLDVDDTNAGHKIRIASFFATDPDDELVGPGEIEGLASQIKSPKPIEHLDGTGHGWALLSDPLSEAPFDPLADELLAFIQGVPAAN
jgi:pimeloyl-ACP methyl ester carboxylesterase